MMTSAAWMGMSTFLYHRLTSPARLIGFQVGEDDAQRRAGGMVAAPAQQVADDVVSFDRAAAFHVAKHGGGHRRSGFGVAVAGALDCRRSWRKPFRRRDGRTFV